MPAAQSAGQWWLLRAPLLALTVLAAAGCGLLADDKEDAPAELVELKPTLRLSKAWSAAVGDGAESLRLALAPASDGSAIVAADHDGRVAAWDAVTGRRLWRVKTGLALSAGPETDGEVVAAGSSNGELLLLSAADGRKLWEQSLSSEVLAAPALSRNRVYVRTVDGKLTALRRDDGGQAWVVQQVVPRLSVRGSGSPLVIGDVVVSGFDNGRVAAYQAADGTPLWDTMLTPPTGRNEVERLVDINASVRAVGQDLYAIGYQGLLAQLALENGQILWSQDLAAGDGIGVDVANVYASGADGDLVAYDRQTGRVLWKHQQLKRRDITGPTAWGNSVVVGDLDGYLHVFDAATGTLQARARVDNARISAAPLVVGELLYALADSGRLAAYRQAPK